MTYSVNLCHIYS